MAHATKQPVGQKWSAKRYLNASRTVSPSCVSESLCSLLDFLLCLLTGSWQPPGSHLHSSLTAGRTPSFAREVLEKKKKKKKKSDCPLLGHVNEHPLANCSGQDFGYAWVSGPQLTQSLWIRM